MNNPTVAKSLLKSYGITDLLNSNVTEVIINRAGEIITEDGDGFHYHDANFSYQDLINLANVLCTLNDKNISAKEPTQSVRLPDGERGHIVIPPACEPETVVFAFRKPSTSRFTLDDYIKTGRLNHFKDTAEHTEMPTDIQLSEWQLQMWNAKNRKDMKTFFQLAVQNHCNICMVGGTGSGKTTFTKAIADLIDHDTRIITIEDTHELDLPYHKNHAHLFYNEDCSAKAIIAACMRLKPDRIFLTELRGDEAWDYLSALNTGHAGGLTSVHANDSRSVFYRIAQLAKESETGQRMDYDYILNTVKSTIDIVCFFKRTQMVELYFDPVAKINAQRNR